MPPKAKAKNIKYSTKKTLPPTPTTPISANQQLSNIKDKFARLTELRKEIQAAKNLYAEHDALVNELLPLFIEQDDDQFIIQREIKIGTKKYRFNPFFYDEKKAKLVSKVWKSTAFESGTIE